MKSLKNTVFQKYKELYFLSFLIFGLSTTAYSQQGDQQKGKASYYADKFNGRRTASGEIFDNNKLTAAHREYEFGTILKVTNIKNGKSVTVVVNDRGPYAHGRILDLTKKAARQLDFMNEGIAEVMIQKVNRTNDENKIDQFEPDKKFKEGQVTSIWGTTRNVTTFGIQVASYESWENALEHAKKIKNNGVELPLIQSYKDGPKEFFRVMAGDFAKREEAEKYLKELKRMNIKGFIKTY